MSAIIEGAGAATQLARIIEAEHTDLPPEQKSAIIQDATQKLVEKLIAAAGALAGAHDDQRANDAFDARREQQRQKALEEKQARYEAAAEAARPAAEARAEARAERGSLEGYQTAQDTLAEVGTTAPASAGERALGRPGNAFEPLRQPAPSGQLRRRWVCVRPSATPAGGRGGRCGRAQAAAISCTSSARSAKRREVPSAPRSRAVDQAGLRRSSSPTGEDAVKSGVL